MKHRNTEITVVEKDGKHLFSASALLRSYGIKTPVTHFVEGHRTSSELISVNGVQQWFVAKTVAERFIKRRRFVEPAQKEMDWARFEYDFETWLESLKLTDKVKSHERLKSLRAEVKAIQAKIAQHATAIKSLNEQLLFLVNEGESADLEDLF